jgi:threonyl-tRNA synthetase
VQAEVQGFLKMLDEVYGTFGLDYSIALSTRPESYLVRK